MAPKQPGKRRVARNMRTLLGQAAQAKEAGRRSSKQGTKGRVICPHCDNNSTKKLNQKNGQIRRECNSCHEQFWSRR